jgi:hypothetical protein
MLLYLFRLLLPLRGTRSNWKIFKLDSASDAAVIPRLVQIPLSTYCDDRSSRPHHPRFPAAGGPCEGATGACCAKTRLVVGKKTIINAKTIAAENKHDDKRELIKLNASIFSPQLLAKRSVNLPGHQNFGEYS